MSRIEITDKNFNISVVSPRKKSDLTEQMEMYACDSSISVVSLEKKLMKL